MSAPLHAPHVGNQDPIDRMDWDRAGHDLDQQGSAILPGLLTSAECRNLAALYPDASRFRSRIVMARHGFGRGEYQYFAYPLPEPIAGMRPALYRRFAPIANLLE